MCFHNMNLHFHVLYYNIYTETVSELFNTKLLLKTDIFYCHLFSQKTAAILMFAFLKYEYRFSKIILVYFTPLKGIQRVCLIFDCMKVSMYQIRKKSFDIFRVTSIYFLCLKYIYMVYHINLFG